MNAIRLFLLVLGATCLASFTLVAQDEEILRLQMGWKFMPGDNPLYASSGFDDSHWKPIQVDKIWEQQGYDPLDGYAWYRLRLVIPSRLRSQAYLKDSVRIFLGKINNFDQVFLNGSVFGMNGQTVPSTSPLDTSFTKADVGMWNVPRRYVLSADDPRIRWDQENVIAVRVFDQGGQGGMWSADQAIAMVALREYLITDVGDKPFVFTETALSKKISPAKRFVATHAWRQLHARIKEQAYR